MRFALIGCGRIAAIHIESIIKYTSDPAQPIEIVALNDTNLFNAKRFKRTYNLYCKNLVNLKKLSKT